MMLKGVVMEGSIIGYNKGGVLVELDGLKGANQVQYTASTSMNMARQQFM
jgi:ribosomal protein S1